MGAAFVALGQTPVDTIAVGMVGDDENAGLGRRSGCADKEGTGNERRNGLHVAPTNEGTALIRISPKG